MGARGRKSSAELAVIDAGGVSTVRRPQAPGDLTAEQGNEWRSIVNAHPAEWLGRERHPMLVDLCRHIVAQRHIAQLVEQNMDAGEDFSLDLHEKLLRMQDREGKAIMTASVRLGIARTAVYEKEKKRDAKAVPPWQKPNAR